VHEAKTRLSQLLRLVDGGQEIGGKRRLGTDEGVFEVPHDFDAPLPDDVLASFSE
jgi:hypothetical protein